MGITHGTPADTLPKSGPSRATICGALPHVLTDRGRPASWNVPARVSRPGDAFAVSEQTCADIGPEGWTGAPDRCWSATTTWTIPIEGRDEWLAAAGLLA